VRQTENEQVRRPPYETEFENLQQSSKISVAAAEQRAMQILELIGQSGPDSPYGVGRDTTTGGPMDWHELARRPLSYSEVSMAMKKYPLVAKSRYPLVAK
jgi:hypothetical protein